MLHWVVLVSMVIISIPLSYSIYGADHLITATFVQSLQHTNLNEILSYLVKQL